MAKNDGNEDPEGATVIPGPEGEIRATILTFQKWPEETRLHSQHFGADVIVYATTIETVSRARFRTGARLIAKFFEPFKPNAVKIVAYWKGDVTDEAAQKEITAIQGGVNAGVKPCVVVNWQSTSEIRAALARI